MLEKEYRHFVTERHAIWERRRRGDAAPWTSDPVLQNSKFCNMFRVLDHGSQFLLREMLPPAYSSDNELLGEEVLFSAFMYRYTNRPDAFEAYIEAHGGSPTLDELDSGELGRFMRDYSANGGPIFGGAYTVFSGTENAGVSRLDWVLGLLQRAFGADSDERVWPAFSAATTNRARLEALKKLPRVADFMGQQILTDYNYVLGDSLDENTFVVPGPGSARGIKRMDPTVKPKAMADFIWDLRAEVISWPDTPRLDGHTLSLMDVQNTLCEFDKYMRYTEKPSRMKYRPAHPEPSTVPLVLPPAWGLL